MMPGLLDDSWVQQMLQQQMMQQGSPPGIQLAADQPTPFGGQGSGLAPEGTMLQQMYEDFARRTGRPEWFGGQQWNGPMRMTPGAMGHPANEALLRQMLQGYGIA